MKHIIFMALEAFNIYVICAIMFMFTDKAVVKASATVSAAAGNVAQPVEKSSVVTRRAHVPNDYASKKSTAASDLDSTSVNVHASLLYGPCVFHSCKHAPE